MDTPEAIAASYLERHATIDISSAFSRGWALVRDHLLVLVGASALAWLVTVGLAFVPILGWIVGFVLLGGLDYLFLRRIRGEAVEIGDVFDGFNRSLLDLTMAGLVKWLLTSLGLVLCILPGIYLAVGYIFALPLVIDKKLEFWTAMEVSRRVVHEHWWSVFALAIVLMLVVFAGFLVCGVGEIIAIPVSSAALMYVYDDLFGTQVVVVPSDSGQGGDGV
jgi:uncharacterized membrane protein